MNTKHPLRAALATLLLTTLSPLLALAQTVINDDFTDPTKWGAPYSAPDKNILVGSGLMNFTATSNAGGGALIPRIEPLLPTTQDWSLKVDVHVDPFTLLALEQYTDVFLGFGKTGDWFNTHVLFEFDRGWWRNSKGYDIGDDVRINGVDAPGLFVVGNLTSHDASLRLDYNAANHTITYLFDADGAANGYNWSAQGSANLASGTYNLNLGPTDTLTVILAGSSSSQIVTPGQAYLDDLQITMNWSPIATTGTGAPISPTSAILTGTVNPNGLTTTAQFEYGLTTAYGSALSVALSPSNGFTAQAVNATLDGLQSGMSYHFRLTAINNGGVAVGDDRTFTLAPLPFTYTTNNGTITITKYTGTNSVVAIPSTINGLPVTTIWHYAFTNCTSLASVTIPDSVTFIGWEAFRNCLSLTNVMIGNNVTNIASYAFRNCTSLTNITIPDSVTTIGDGAFLFCNGLTNITIPKNVTTIGIAPFSGCKSLRVITVDALNSFYTSADGVLFDKIQTALIQYPAARVGSSYTIPDTVTSIGAEAFSGCNSLASITVPNSVTSIAHSAFGRCTSLTTVNIPNGVTSVAFATFSGCTSLTSITIPDSATSIESSAFSGCTGLTNVTIGNSVNSIGDNAFYSCASLRSLTIPASVNSIGVWVFRWCDNLGAVYFRGNTPSLGGDFYGVYPWIYYLPGTTGWGPTFGGCWTALWTPGPTVVTTGTATDITFSSATLNGTVNPNGLSTTAQFEYGLTTAYGSTASVVLSPNNGTTAQAASTSLTGLQPERLYHYRLKATNTGGAGVGNDAIFTTASFSGVKGIALRHNRQLAPDGSWSYSGDFEAGIQVAGAQSVNLLRPDGGLTVLATYGDPDWWTVREGEDFLATFQSRFADGIYVFRVTLPGTTVIEVPLDTRIIPMPGEYPELSGIQAEAQWPANTPLPLQWEPWTLNRQGDDVMLFLDNEMDGNNQAGYFVPIGPTVTNHVVPGSALPDNSRFHTWVHFANWSTNDEVVKQTASHVEFQTGIPQVVLEYDIDLIHVWVPSQHGDRYHYIFEAEVEAFGATHVTVTTPIKAGFPAGENLELHNESTSGRQEWWLEVDEGSPTAFSTRFPDGLYTFTVWFVDGSHKQEICEVGATWPSSFPQPTPETPAAESTVDPSAPIAISWAPWIHTNPVDGKTISFGINELGYGTELIDVQLASSATSYTILPGTLRPGGLYLVTVQFETTFGNGNDKDKTLALQYSTSPSIPPGSVKTLPSGHFQFQASSLPGAVLEIQASSNLTHWAAIATLTNTTGFAWFTDTSTNVAQRFFRLKLADSFISGNLGHDSAGPGATLNDWAPAENFVSIGSVSTRPIEVSSEYYRANRGQSRSSLVDVARSDRRIFPRSLPSPSPFLPRPLPLIRTIPIHHPL